MSDVFSREKRSQVMAMIRSKNTKPEILVRRYLFSMGFRYRIHCADLPGRPDVVLKKYRTVILVHGCFWHLHKNCGFSRMPSTRQEYWKPKLERNQFRDIANIKALKKVGWKVIIVWECALKKKMIEKTLSTLVDKIIS